MSNPEGFKADSVTHYVPLKVLKATEITVTQSLIFLPSNIYEFGDDVSSFIFVAWSCSTNLVGRMYLASNGAFLLQTVSSFHERGQLGEEADKACSTTSYNCRIILAAGDL